MWSVSSAVSPSRSHSVLSPSLSNMATFSLTSELTGEWFGSYKLDNYLAFIVMSFSLSTLEVRQMNGATVQHMLNLGVCPLKI